MRDVPSVLVVGGAGYIGSHMTAFLREAGCKVTVFDNLSTGFRDAVPRHGFVRGDLRRPESLRAVFSRRRFDAVMHFASFIQVGESVREPSRYYTNNLANTLHLLDEMRSAGVRTLVFSSTAAVYGEPEYLPIDEAHPCRPLNPYGRSKWMVEQILQDYGSAYGMRYSALRYFNAAGADPRGRLGERHDPETHLVPLVLQVASGRRESVTVFGRDYDTPDGTCIRDYVHVTDLCQAHWLALNALLQGAPSSTYNLGNGNGHSVQQVIETARQVTGAPIAVSEAGRRYGDPARLVASSVRAQTVLGWRPRHAELAEIIRHAWAWEQRMCSGSNGH